MAYNLYFNAAATDPKGALCKSITNLTPSNPPAWVVGEARAVNIYIADGNGDFDPISGDATAEIMLGLGVLGSVPTGGTFTITSGANTTSALAFDASSSDIETALNDLASITSEGGVSVSGAFPVFAVDWNTTGAKALMAGDGSDLTPDSDAAISQVRAGDGSTKERQLIQLRQQPAALQTAFSTIDDGWSGTLNLNTRGIVDLVGTLAAVSDAYLELRVTDASGNVRVYGQVGNVIRNNVIDPLSLIPVPLPDYLTADGCRAQFVQNRSTITALTGGTSGCLDAILTANDAAQTGWLVAVTIDDEMSVYQLQSGGDAESVPDVIRPDDFNGSTNLRIWRLVSSSSNGGDGTLRYWTESTEVVDTTQASKWTPNVTGLDPVPADAVPDVTSDDPVVFGSYPAGTYRVNYVGGGMRYGPGLTQFKINASGSYGFRVIHSGGTEIEGPATSYTGYNTVAELEAANAGAFVEFTHTGGDISLYLLDSPYDDNTAGTPSPTFELVGANADVHALIQPKGNGSVVLADDTGDAPEPTADAQLTARFAGGYKFDGGNATFEGTAAGDDPVDAQDFVTKAYLEAHGGGTRPPYAMPASEADFDEADVFTKTLAADITVTFANVPDGASFQILLTQPDPAKEVTWPAAVAWVGGGADPQAPAGQTTIFTFLRVGSTYHGVAALAAPAVAWGNLTGTLAEQADLQAALDAKADNGRITAEAGEAISARQVVWQDTEDRLGNGRTKWYPEDLSASPPNVGPVRGMAVTEDDGTSEAAGATWTARDSSRLWEPVASSADGSVLVAGTTNSNIFVSTDSGVTWVSRSPTGVRGAASSADGVKLVVVRYGGQIYTSTDSGANWTARESDRLWFGVASSADGVKLVAVVNGGQIYTSTDSGETWTARDSSRSWRKVASSADGVKLVATVAGGQIYTSTDSGETWTARDSNRDWQGVASSANGTKLVAVTNEAGSGRIYTSTDSGATWTQRESARAWDSVASSADGTKLLAAVNTGASTGLLYTSTDSGVTWTPRESGRNWNGVASSDDGNKLVATVYSGQIYTSVGGAYTPGSFTCLTEPGDVSGFTGLTPGAKQFSDSATPGGLTETEPAADEIRRFNGRALSATVLRFDPRGFEPQQEETPDPLKYLNELGHYSSPVLTATASLDFPNILAASSADLTITVTGAAVGDAVVLGPPAAPDASLVFMGFVSAADTVTVRAFNIGALAVDQGAMTFRATVIKS